MEETDYIPAEESLTAFGGLAIIARSYLTLEYSEAECGAGVAEQPPI
jgi:hypothetical protein